jgi:hypothetical protein
MSLFKLTALMIASCLLCKVNFSQSSNVFKAISLNNLDAFREPGTNWVIASDAVADYTKPYDIQPVKGEGAIVNVFKKNKQMHLITREEFGDVEVDLDFMMAKESNSGIYLQGKYEVQLLDSWTNLNPGSGDLGGIYQRYSQQRGTYEGNAPLMNVAKAPGLWQHMKIKFTAPKFSSDGKKISNARFDEVTLNGIVIQQNAEVTGPTGYDISPDESSKGPLLFQGDHGPVAFKNIRYRQPDTTSVKSENADEVINPILAEPAGKPLFIKTFLKYGDKKLTHVLSAGFPSKLNYSYDVKQGALFQVWRGSFIDLTQAWFDRGEEQLGVPTGSVTILSDAPSMAILADENAPWPDSIAFDDMNNHGYVLNKQRSPTFMYSMKGFEVRDSIVAAENGENITRTFTVDNAPQNLYCRIAAGNNIEKATDDLYTVNSRSYYIKADKKYQPIIRKTSSSQELLIKYGSAGPVTYSIIW